MSIKAKIEAIIYAAEEPVTIDQMAVLLRNDVLGAIAGQERLAAAEAEAQADEQLATSPVEIAESAEVPPVADAVPATGSEGPSGTRSHPERAPDLDNTGTEDAPTEAHNVDVPEAEAPSQNAEAAEGTTETTTAPVQADDIPAAADEPSAAEASTSALQPPPKKRKPADPELPRIRQFLRRTIEEMIVSYADENRGIEIRAIAGGFRMTTKPEHHDVVRAFAKSLKPAIRLSLQALETLAVIAYKQPVTVPEISEIRGVDSGGVIATLLERKLITTAGRKAVIGRPILYKTTKEFLLRFGLNELGELPSMEEFEKLAQEQTDLFDKDAAPENAPLPPPDEPTAEQMDGDVSDGADTAESIVRAQIGEDAGVAEEPMPQGAGDFSSGADTAESVVREQVEDEKQD